MALTDKSSIVVPRRPFAKAGVLQGFNPTKDANGNITGQLVDFDVTRNTTATRINEQGLIENVAANVPRRDFLNGGCGELLVEPQRTNFWVGSEGTDIVLNSPRGEFSFYTLNNNNVTRTISYAGDITFTFIVKKTDGTVPTISNSNGNGDLVVFVSGGSGAGTSGTLTNIGNGFYFFKLLISANGSSIARIQNNSGVDTFVSLIQYEQGEYPTSYIPTTASAVTRNQDVISATNIGSLLNDAEGGLYVKASVFSKTQNMMLSLSDDTLDNRLIFFIKVDNTILNNVRADGSSVFSVKKNGYNINQVFNLACKYAQNNFSYYVNGSKVGASVLGNTFANGTLNSLKFGNFNGGFPFYGRISELIVFNNAPTDSELQTLTTP